MTKLQTEDENDKEDLSRLNNSIKVIKFFLLLTSK